MHVHRQHHCKLWLLFLNVARLFQEGWCWQSQIQLSERTSVDLPLFNHSSFIYWFNILFSSLLIKSTYCFITPQALSDKISVEIKLIIWLSHECVCHFVCLFAVFKLNSCTNIPFVDCGRQQSTSRIIGGSQAKLGQWPWQLTLHFRGSHICGGVLISPDFLLTAAHCFPR